MELRLIGYWAAIADGETPRRRRTLWHARDRTRKRAAPQESLRAGAEGSAVLPNAMEFVDGAVSRQERNAVASYLDAGVMVRVAAGLSPCRICGTANGCGERSDGAYLWPDGLAHYVREHSVRLPADFVQHALKGQAMDSDGRELSIESIERMPLDRRWWIAATGGVPPPVPEQAPTATQVSILLPDGTEADWSCEIRALNPFADLRGRQVSRMVLRSRQSDSWTGDGNDVFECLTDLRRQLEPIGYRVCCNGARRNAWPWPFARGGVSTVVLIGEDVQEAGKEPQGHPMLPTLDPAVPSEIVSLEEQFAWLASHGHPV